MKKTSRESNVEGKIVNVSSEGHRLTYKEGIRFDKINDEAEYVIICFPPSVYFIQGKSIQLMFYPVLCRYGTIGAYGQSKLANILHANELARRFKV
jgi:NAD(P)-dependent dehydrogenase (short-subunit alcohol dehydrogenase family)